MDASNTSTTRLNRPAKETQPGGSRVWRMLTVGGRVSRRTALVLWLIAAIGVALYFGWNLVVAAGLSGIVLGLLPCAAMCALGLCGADSGKKCASDARNANGDDR